MVNSKIVARQSLSAAVISTIIDQLYHIARGYIHQFSHLLDSSLSAETAYYIGLKFLFVFIVSFFVLKNVKGSIIKLSLIIGIITALLFSIVLTYMFPGSYGLTMHMLHIMAIFLGAYITIKYKIGGTKNG